MILKNSVKIFLINFLFVLSIFLCDRLSKVYVISLIDKFPENEIFSSQFLNIVLIWNDGIAFGLFSFKENLYNILTFVILLIILIIIYIAIKSNGLRRYSLLMIIGGALGNVYDRIFNKSVPDFIDFHIGNFHWFVFNVADIFITLGVLIMISLEYIDSSKKN